MSLSRGGRSVLYEPGKQPMEPEDEGETKYAKARKTASMAADAVFGQDVKKKRTRSTLVDGEEVVEEVEEKRKRDVVRRAGKRLFRAVLLAIMVIPGFGCAISIYSGLCFHHISKDNLWSQRPPPGPWSRAPPSARENAHLTREEASSGAGSSRAADERGRLERLY